MSARSSERSDIPLRRLANPLAVAAPRPSGTVTGCHFGLRRASPPSSPLAASRRGLGPHVGVNVGIRHTSRGKRVEESGGCRRIVWRRRPESNRRLRFCRRDFAVPVGSQPDAIVLHSPGFSTAWMFRRVCRYSTVGVRLVGNASALRWSTRSAGDAPEGVSSRAAEGTTEGS